MKLKAFQQQDLENIKTEWAKGKPFILGNYTGSGKTNILLQLCKDILEKEPKARIGILAFFQRNIKEQIFERASHFLKPGQYQKLDRTDHEAHANVMIFNPHYFVHYETEVKFDYFIIDEAHYGTAPGRMMIENIISGYTHKKTKFLYVTATSWKLSKLLPEVKTSVRGLDKGIGDGLSSDFNIRSIRFKFKLAKKNFNRKGDLKQTSHEVAKMIAKKCAAFALKLKRLPLGNKILVITPPGLDTIVADTVTEALGSEAIRWTRHFAHDFGGRKEKFSDFELEQFKKEKKLKYLVTCRKGQVGLDYPYFSAVIDFTMTRNIMQLVQRYGRLARKCDIAKNYLYIHDDSLSPDHVQWIINTSVSYACCEYKGFSGSIFNVSIPVNKDYQKIKNSFTKITEYVKNPGRFKNTKLFTFNKEAKHQGYWTLEKVKNEIKKYKSRTEFASKNMYLYRWMRQHHNDVLNEVFPYKNKLVEWSPELLVSRLKEFKNQKEFYEAYQGGYDYIRLNGLKELADEILPPMKNWEAIRKWDKQLVIDYIRENKVSKISDMPDHPRKLLRKKNWREDALRAINENRTAEQKYLPTDTGYARRKQDKFDYPPLVKEKWQVPKDIVKQMLVKLKAKDKNKWLEVARKYKTCGEFMREDYGTFEKCVNHGFYSDLLDIYRQKMRGA